jgi:hypothetical protein
MVGKITPLQTDKGSCLAQLVASYRIESTGFARVRFLDFAPYAPLAIALDHNGRRKRTHFASTFTMFTTFTDWSLHQPRTGDRAGGRQGILARLEVFRVVLELPGLQV